MTNQEKLDILAPKMEQMIDHLEKAGNLYQEMKKEVTGWPNPSKDEKESSMVNEWALRMAKAYEDLELD